MRPPSSHNRIFGANLKLYPEMTARWDFDGIVADLHHCASVSGIAEKAMMFPEYIIERLSDHPSNETIVKHSKSCRKYWSGEHLFSCEYSQVIPLLLLTKDPLAFEEYLKSAEKRGKRKVSPDVHAVYRELPGSSPQPCCSTCRL